MGFPIHFHVSVLQFLDLVCRKNGFPLPKARDPREIHEWRRDLRSSRVKKPREGRVMFWVSARMIRDFFGGSSKATRKEDCGEACVQTGAKRATRHFQVTGYIHPIIGCIKEAWGGGW